jgi:hypothetical protein
MAPVAELPHYWATEAGSLITIDKLLLELVPTTGTTDRDRAGLTNKMRDHKRRGIDIKVCI